ncbi:MAG: hypothetical protein JWP31_613 [Aeromicrobium sp.]|nr:hypothetical protein [Aeromicrobium sp.]
MGPTDTASRTSRRRRAARDAGLQVVLLVGSWLTYLLVRHVAEGGRGVSMRHADDVWQLERTLQLPSEARVQDWALGSDALIHVVNGIYAWVHFPVIVTTLALLYVRRREAYRWFRDVLILTTGLALIGHVVYPLAPPRMRPDLGMVDTGLAFGQSTYGGDPGTGFANQYAAMPSMHVGWAVLVSLTVVLCLRTRWRWIAPAYAVMILLVVVISGNHYWLDGAVGAVLLGVSLWVLRRRRPRGSDPTARRPSGAVRRRQ